MGVVQLWKFAFIITVQLTWVIYCSRDDGITRGGGSIMQINRKCNN